MLGGLLGGIFGDKAKQTMNADDRRNLRSAYMTDIGNKLDTSGLGQTNAILGVYDKPAVGARTPLRDVNADISATNLARDKQAEDDRIKKQQEAIVTASLAKQDATPERLADILAKYSFLFKR